MPESFEELADRAARDALGLLGGDPCLAETDPTLQRYFRRNAGGEIIRNIYALRREGIQVLNDTGTVIDVAIAYDLLVSEVGDVVAGDIIVDQGVQWKVSFPHENNGTTQTLQVQAVHGDTARSGYS